jgi:hypothetical protein
MGSLAGAAAGAAGSATVEAQAPAKVAVPAANRELGATLRALNESAGLGVTPEEIDRAEAYVTGAILETRAKLRPLVLDERLDLPVVFQARKER